MRPDPATQRGGKGRHAPQNDVAPGDRLSWWNPRFDLGRLQDEIEAVQRAVRHVDFHIRREIVVDVDLHLAVDVTHHAENSRVVMMIVRERLAADEDQRLVTRHRKMEFVEVNQVAEGVFEANDLIWMTGRARLEALEDEAIAWTTVNQDVPAPASDLRIVAARWLYDFVGPLRDSEV